MSLWVEKDKMLLAFDVMKISFTNGQRKKEKEVYLKPSDYNQSTPRAKEIRSNGLALGYERPVDPCLARGSAKYITLAGTYGGERFNSQCYKKT